MKPGTYTIELSLDTETKLGVLKSKRTITIDDMVWDRLMTSHSSATPAKAAAIQEQLSSKYHRLFIKSGQQVLARESPVGGLSAKVTWHADKSGLKANVQVKDPLFASCTPAMIEQGAAYLTLSTAAPGSKGQIWAVTLLPSGQEGQARVFGSKETSATWKKTAAGYDMDVKIPWSSIDGLKPSTTLLPVQVAINSRTDDGLSRSAITGSSDGTGARSFLVLRVK